MATITAIEVQKKNKTRCSVYLDGEFAMGLDTLTVLQNGLKVGREITGEELSLVQFESEKNVAFEKTAAYVSRYRKTEKEVFFYLRDKGYENAVVQFVIKKLKEYKFIDDALYAKDYLRANENKKSLYKIKYELKGKGVSDFVLDDLSVSEDLEFEAAKALSDKFMKSRDVTRENMQKLYRHLAGKGYSYDIFTRIKDGYHLEFD